MAPNLPGYHAMLALPLRPRRRRDALRGVRSSARATKRRAPRLRTRPCASSGRPPTSTSGSTATAAIRPRARCLEKHLGIATSTAASSRRSGRRFDRALAEHRRPPCTARRRSAVAALVGIDCYSRSRAWCGGRRRSAPSRQRRAARAASTIRTGAASRDRHRADPVILAIRRPLRLRRVDPGASRRIPAASLPGRRDLHLRRRLLRARPARPRPRERSVDGGNVRETRLYHRAHALDPSLPGRRLVTERTTSTTS